MNFPGDSTWTISNNDSHTFALYVRDALGIDTPTAASIPPLHPPVPRSGLPVPHGFADAWDRWWEGSHGTPRLPDLWPPSLPEELWIAYSQWRDPTGPEATRIRDQVRRTFGQSIHELVTDLERELGHRPVFCLELVQIPVEGQYWRRLTKDTVLVSDGLMSSRNLIAPLESVIRELAR